MYWYRSSATVGANGDDRTVQKRGSVHRLLLRDVVRQRDRPSLSCERQRLLPLGGRDQVGGAQFIQFAPTAPLYLFPIIESVHVIGLTMVFGTILIIDLRLLGLASSRRPFTAIAADVLRWTWLAFAVTATTGALMFVTNAGHLLRQRLLPREDGDARAVGTQHAGIRDDRETLGPHLGPECGGARRGPGHCCRVARDLDWRDRSWALGRVHDLVTAGANRYNIDLEHLEDLIPK